MTDGRIAAVLGAGGAGHGLSAYLARQGYTIRLWNRPDPREEREWLAPVRERGALEVLNWEPGSVPIERATTDIGSALEGASLVAVAVNSSVQREVAHAVAGALEPGQVVLLTTGGSFGALEFQAGLVEAGAARRTEILLAELLTTVVNSNVRGPGRVFVLGAKQRIPLAALPATETPRVMERLAGLPFVAAPDLLSVGLANFALTNHVVPMVLNASRIEGSPDGYRWYPDGMTPSVVRAVERAEAERQALAAALGVATVSLREYLAESVGAPAGDLLTALRDAPLYGKTPAPRTLDHRWLIEDTLTAVVPMLSLGRAIGCRLPMLEATLTYAEALSGRDLWAEGRTVEKMGLAGLDAAGIRRRVQQGEHDA